MSGVTIMSSLYYTGNEYILNGILHGEVLNINGYNVKRPYFFKNKAHARGFEIAVILANRKPTWSGITILDTIECIDIIKYQGAEEIHLNDDAVNPRVPAHDAMKYVPAFFDYGVVNLSCKKKRLRTWFLEIDRNKQKRQFLD
jgi:hypothetical protein